MRLSPSPVSMFCAGSGVSDALRVLVVLHEDEVPVLEEALGVVARQVVGAAELQAPVEVELGARAARPGRAGLPEIVVAGQPTMRSRGTPSDSQAAIASSSGPSPSSSSPANTVIQIASESNPSPCTENSSAYSAAPCLK